MTNTSVFPHSKYNLADITISTDLAGNTEFTAGMCSEPPPRPPELKRSQPSKQQTFLEKWKSSSTQK